MFPSSPSRAVPDIRPTARLSVRLSVPSKTGTSRLIFGIVSTARGLSESFVRLVLYAEFVFHSTA